MYFVLDSPEGWGMGLLYEGVKRGRGRMADLLTTEGSCAEEVSDSLKFIFNYKAGCLSADPHASLWQPHHVGC
jgi:hypothetical protein